MNLYILVDLEGISGICSREQIFGKASRINEGRVLMTEDINACVDAAKEMGVEKIYVRDCHGSSNTVIYEKLSDNADYYICGYMGEQRYMGIEDCDAVILLGYHAMAGTLGGVLEHSWSSACIQNIFINGIKRGEIAMDSAAAALYNKPVIMISGDDAACREAREIMPEIVCVRWLQKRWNFNYENQTYE